jgi:3-dehydroquinate synthase
LPDGEAHKNWETLQLIFDGLLTARHDRRTTVVALGGGVIGDMAGFAAACYQRGVDFIQVPTTLLSQVDSSVGGKTGINHPLGKNMVGAFYQPNAVLIDTTSLKTLPARELSAGLAEVIKYGLICDEPFLAWLEDNIRPCAPWTGSPDRSHRPFLRGQGRGGRCRRARVGRTGHAEPGPHLRPCHRNPHGLWRLVAWRGRGGGHGDGPGDVHAPWLDRPAERDRGIRLLQDAGLPVVPPQEMTPAHFMEHMAVDKKVLDGRLRLVLLRQMGEAVVTDDYPKEILQATLAADYRAIVAQL